jgi:hypothetical protein
MVVERKDTLDETKEKIEIHHSHDHKVHISLLTNVSYGKTSRAGMEDGRRDRLP